MNTALIVGLGNPGREFEKTRHNIGFMAADKIAANFQLPPHQSKHGTGQAIFNFQSKFNAEISEGKIGKRKIILAKPQTFMNNSGKAIGAIAKYYKIKPENIIVIHDDADLPIGTLRIVRNRGSAGHKGVESIMRALKTKDFIRFRIGTKPTQSGKIPHRPKKEMAEFLVEKKITPSQEEILEKTIKRCVEAIEITINEGAQKAMSEFN